MSSFVDFLKNLLSGVVSFFGGLFSSKEKQGAIAGTETKPRKARNSGYFLELDDAKGISSIAAAPAKTAVAPASTNAAKEPAKLEPAKLEHAKADAALASVPQSAPQSQPTAQPAAAKTEPKPAAANAALNLPQPTVTTFAPNYLAPNGSSNGRRRPGANMSSFLDMARQVKTSS